MSVPIRIPVALRKRIAADAKRCGRSFEEQVLALLRRHYGEDVDIAPSPAAILAMAVASLAEIPPHRARVSGQQINSARLQPGESARSYFESV